MIFLLILLGGSASLRCDFYSCLSDGTSENICQSFNETTSTYAVRSCPDDLVCDVSSSDSETVTCSERVSEPEEAQMGEKCSSEVPCVLGTCMDGICKGFSEGSDCSSDEDCDIGLSCSGDICRPLIGLGEFGCQRDFDCTLRGGCNATNGTQDGSCVKYFSLSNGKYVTNCKDNYSPFCKTGYCTRAQLFSDLGVCSRPPKSDRRLPVECSDNSQCSGGTRDVELKGKCVCGRNRLGTAYCEPFIGDSPGKRLVNVLGDIAGRVRDRDCNTAKRFQPECVRRIGRGIAEEFRLAQLYYAYYPLLQENPRCVRNSVNSFFYNRASAIFAAALILIFN